MEKLPLDKLLGAGFNTCISRRRLAWLGLCGLSAITLPGLAQEKVKAPYLADMHSHYGQFPRRMGSDMARHMRETGITLLSWSIIDDARWRGRTPTGTRQISTPAPGELWAYFQAAIAEHDRWLTTWGVTKALTPADIDAALAGEPRVLLATEAANFLEGQVGRLSQAHAWGVRHLQLVHFILNPLGDHQTAEPTLGGLTALGSQAIVECKRLGMLVDLAHGTATLVDAALDASDAAMVWSHSWISPAGGVYGQVPPYLSRSLALPQARKIAARGGVVGLWSLSTNDAAYPVKSVQTYADEIVRMCDLIGARHVAFGTDMDGAGANPVLGNYKDLRDVADNLVKRGLSEGMLNDVFIGNYARVVKQAMNGANKT